MEKKRDKPSPATYTEARSEIERLVERFARNLDAYKRAEYKEAHVRVEFIDPLFEALGWDVRNVRGYAEQYKDVIHEDAIKIGGATRAPDYCFRVGGTRKFFLEAKKPSVSVKGDVGPAYQLRRYAWSAKLPLSILTDFEEFAVYDCRQRPKPNDGASVGRITYLTFDQYLDRFDDVYGVFARESVLQGSFDRYVQDTKRKRGTSEVDAEFLKEIEGWRETLARHIALRNPALSVHELNFAVQRTVDRFIFLRMCEDRSIEEYGRLLALTGGPHIYARLGDLYRQAEEKYNSGIFDFQADTLTKSLTIDDKVLKPILASLYYPQSPYEFSVLPPEVLGQVYEQFLGKVIRLTPAHRAKVEEKPEVKKAGGVYYTPTYIVDYIVQQTVGKLVAGKTPRQISKLRILDPACGSGSFLLGAYQYLLDYHRQWYEDHDPARYAKGKHPAVYQAGPSPPPLGPPQPWGGSGGGEWRLTTAEKKRILLNNIYGVDIDRQAVEVTKLSLLLKVLEGENEETLGRQLALWRERALPNLGDNIKCGNSLIGPDYFAAQLLPDEEEMRRVNPFDWEAEFPEVMGAGGPSAGSGQGFDVVIGNPPYGAYYTEADKAYFKSHYVYKKGKPETYIYFMEQGMKLLSNQGRLGYITPNAWLTNYYGAQIRRHVFAHTSLQQIVDLEPTKVFKKAVVDTAITILSKDTLLKGEKATEVLQGTADYRIVHKFAMPQSVWEADSEAVINLHANPAEMELLARMEAGAKTLDSLVEYSQGVIPYKTKADGQANLYIAPEKRGDEWLPLIERASQVRRYEVGAPEAFIHYGPWLWCQRDSRFFSQPKILFHRLRKKLPVQLIGALDETGAINRHSSSNLVLRPDVPAGVLFAVLGLFNSRLANWWFVKRYGLLMEVGGFKVSKLPLPKSWDEGYEQMVMLVERMLELHHKIAAATVPPDKQLYQRQIEATDRQINALVYELYGLREEEIAIVEGRNH